MEQLKVVLAWLKKHHFWVLAGIIVAVVLTLWVTATADVADRCDERKGQIESRFDALESIQSDPSHPNDNVIKAYADATEITKGKVLEIWVKLYQEQKDKNQLPADLDQGFRIAFEAGGEIPPSYREEYQNFISGYVSRLFYEELNVRRPKGGDVSDQISKTTELVGIVDWDAGSRQQIEQRFKWGDPPTTEMVREAQEDLWVYEALVRIIKNTNQGATRHDNAVVKRIDALEIGENVLSLGSSPRNVGLKLPGSRLVEHSTKPSRYVDEKGLPLQRRNAPPYYNHPFAEFKMMPIRLRVLIDQKQIPKLLVECANSKMPIEIRRVRMRPGKGSLFSVNDSYGVTLTRQLLGASPLLREAKQGKDLDDVDVELSGVICIYNPPNRETLGTGTAAAGSAGTPPAATTPAATPPAATPPTAPLPEAGPPGAPPTVPGGGPGPVTGG